MEAVNIISRAAYKARAALLAGIVLASGCATSNEPKTLFIEGITTPEHSALVQPTQVPGGLMMISGVDQKSTHTFSLGFLGSVYVPPGVHEFEVYVWHDFYVSDPGGPEWGAPPGVQVAPVEGTGGVLVKKGVAKPQYTVEAGKGYEIKFGFDRTHPSKPIPVAWVSPLPNQ